MSTTACDDQLTVHPDDAEPAVDPALEAQREQVADLILGHSEGMKICSLLEKDMNYGPDTTYRFAMSDGKERLGVSITITPLQPIKAI